MFTTELINGWLQKHNIVTGCADGLIRLFNASTGQLIKQFREHIGGVEKLDIGSEKIVSTGIDKLVYSVVSWSITNLRMYKLSPRVRHW